jgi:hypothetical protein
VTAANAAKMKKEFEKKKGNIIAAVFNDLEGEDSDLDVFGPGENSEYVPPTSLPTHLWWPCYVDAANGCSSSPVKTLIDHGSRPVLISREFALGQGYRLKKLRKPYDVLAAISKKKEEDSQNLDHYCKLHFVSTDNVWRSYTIDAVVCLDFKQISF